MTKNPELTNAAQLGNLHSFKKSVADFVNLTGPNLLTRTHSFFEWQNSRRKIGCWPYSNAISHTPMPVMEVTDDAGRSAQGLNFASQDYLSLSSHIAVHHTAKEALEKYGPHSAGSAALQGNTKISLELEEELANTFQVEEVTLFPTGWAAGYGTIRGLIRNEDHVILDNLCHNCLSEGAHAATSHVHRVTHLSGDHLQEKLQAIRQSDAKNGILVVTEGLFSMDADIPDIHRLQEICHAHSAILLVDVAHDFGSMGPRGTGSIGAQGMLGKVDLVMGSFSKTFASNGGFLATNSRAVKEYIKFYGASNIFSNALSPIQASVVRKALQIVRSDEGNELRDRLMKAVKALRDALQLSGISCLGLPSPIVPVPLGSEMVARLTASRVFSKRLFANLVEFPAVAKGKARFRMQVMANHSEEDSKRAADIIAECLKEAKKVAEEFNG